MESRWKSEQRFKGYGDRKLCQWWNAKDGAVSWLLSLEQELNRRGYITRDPFGKPAFIMHTQAGLKV